jgi:hypothetical protein
MDWGWDFVWKTWENCNTAYARLDIWGDLTQQVNATHRAFIVSRVYVLYSHVFTR